MASGIEIPIGGDLAPFLQAVAELRGDFSKLSAHTAGEFKKVTEAAKTSASQIKSAFGALKDLIPFGSMFGNVAQFTTIQGIIHGFIDEVKGAVSGASAFEDMTVEMEQFTGSAEAARAVLSDLSKLTLRTPFAGGPIRESALKLLQSGVPQDQAVSMTKDLTAVSKSPEQLAEFTDAMGKGYDMGTIKQKQLNVFLTNHVDILSAIGRQLHLNQADTLAAVQVGIGFDVVAAALHSMSQEGGQFFELMERKGATYSGMIQKLENAWGGVKRAFVQPMLEGLAPFLDYAREKIGKMKEAAAEAGAKVKLAMAEIFVAFRDGQVTESLGLGLRLAISGAINLLMEGFAIAGSFLAALLPPLFKSAMEVFSDKKFWWGIKDILTSVFTTAAVALLDVLPGIDKKARAHEMETAASIYMGRGRRRLSEVDTTTSFSDTFAKSLTDAVKAAGYTAKTFQDSPMWKAATADAAAMGQTLKLRAQQVIDQFAPKEVPAGTVTQHDKNPEDQTPSNDESSKPNSHISFLATTLGKLGGDKAFAFFPMLNIGQQQVAEQRKTNTYLQKLVNSQGAKIPVTV